MPALRRCLLTPPNGESELNDELLRLAGVLLSEESTASLLTLVVELVAGVVGPAHGVGVTLAMEGRVGTAAYSDPFVQRVDLMQYEAGDGPCITSARERVIVRVEDLTADDRWPGFAENAVTEGVTAVLSVPLVLDDSPFGALNMYARDGGFSERDEEIATRFAHQAAVVMTNSQAYLSASELNDQLTLALKSRDMIGQAKGILMTQRSISADEAFTVLREISQNTNRKLRDVAEETVRGIEEPPS